LSTLPGEADATGDAAEVVIPFEPASPAGRRLFRARRKAARVLPGDVMPQADVTGDPELVRLTEQVRASLLVDPAELRESESVRAETAMKASGIAAQMSAYMGGYRLAAVAG